MERRGTFDRNGAFERLDLLREHVLEPVVVWVKRLRVTDRTYRLWSAHGMSPATVAKASTALSSSSLVDLPTHLNDWLSRGARAPDWYADMALRQPRLTYLVDDSRDYEVALRTSVDQRLSSMAALDSLAARYSAPRLYRALLDLITNSLIHAFQSGRSITRTFAVPVRLGPCVRNLRDAYLMHAPWSEVLAWYRHVVDVNQNPTGLVWTIAAEEHQRFAHSFSLQRERPPDPGPSSLAANAHLLRLQALTECTQTLRFPGKSRTPQSRADRADIARLQDDVHRSVVSADDIWLSGTVTIPMLTTAYRLLVAADMLGPSQSGFDRVLGWGISHFVGSSFSIGDLAEVLRTRYGIRGDSRHQRLEAALRRCLLDHTHLPGLALEHHRKRYHVQRVKPAEATSPMAIELTSTIAAPRT